jgi:solute carrier family 13 (sodium-dependent dicarboxylate transporter), member 2/3/5
MASVDAAPRPIDSHEQGADSVLARVGQVLCVLVPIGVWFAPLPLEPQTQHAFAIVGFMVIAWITQAMEFALAGFIGCFLFWALGIVRFEQAFSGFANDTPWFLFAAMLIGLMTSKTGLARRLAYNIMLMVGSSYPRILLGLIITDFLLTIIVPSGLARVVILAAIALALCEAFNAQRGSNIARGMFLVLTYTANIFDKMIIAGAGAITATGLMRTFGGVDVSWGEWFLAFLPCSIITVLTAWALTLAFYRPERTVIAGGKDFFRAQLKALGSWSLSEKKAAAMIGLAILLWVTDFLHHIPPVMVALGVGLFALLPRVGLLDANDMRTLNYLPVFFVAEAVSMGHVLGITKGLEVLTHNVFAWMEPFFSNIVTTTVVMYWTAFVYHFLLASEISMLGTSIPLVMGLAKAHSMSPLLLGMIWTFAAGGKLFAYQSGVLIVGYSYGYFDARDLVRIGWWLTVVEFFVLLLMVPFYWPLIGIH